MKKRFISVFLSLAVVLTAITGFASTTYAAEQKWTSGGLTCTLDTGSGLFTVSGSGSGADYKTSYSSRAPWYSIYRSQIKNVVIESGVKYIGNYWFYGCTKLETIVFSENSTVEKFGSNVCTGCTGTTYWLDIPESMTSIGSNAFSDTNFNYVKIFSPSISIQTNSFKTSSYARFFGLPDSGARTFVESGQNAGYDWHYYCLNDNHSYVTDTIAPTCTEQGYDLYYCPNCDADSTKSNITEPLGHNFSNASATADGSYIYSCTRCGSTDLKVSAVELMTFFSNAISHENDNKPFYQSNYDQKFDIHYDGYINTKDFLLIKNSVNKINITDKQTTIDTAKVYQTIDGFGASGAWWAQDVGRWTDEQIDVITELLYGETGAGLDIYRYNLGGGSENDTTIGDWRRRAEDFLSPASDINDASTYDWNADAAAQKVLASAQRANSDLKVTLFSNTPPVSITKNGHGYCDAHTEKTSITGKKTVTYYSNLDSSNYQSFATYIANCAEHFMDMGYNVTCVSPINEPGWSWDGPTPSQEGCHYSADEARSFYNNYMIPTLKSSSKLNGKVDVSIWECEQLQIDTRDNNSEYYKKFLPAMFSSASGYASNNTNIRSYADSFDTHSYWAGTAEKQATANDIAKSEYSAIKKVRQTEYCQMTNDGNTGCYNHYDQEGRYNDGNGLGIYYGLALADIIHQDMTILNAVEWDWWVACAGGVYTDGLIYYNDDPDDLQVSKRLWVMGNWARFIKEGAKRVEVTTGKNFAQNLKTEKTYGSDKMNYIEQTAYLNPDGSVVVVYINNSDTDEFTTFGSEYTGFVSYVTDADRDLEKYQVGSTENAVVHIPSKSVTTVVLK